MPIAEDKVRESLKQVVDPELFVNIIDLGLVYAVDIQPATACESSEEPKSETDEPGEAADAAAMADDPADAADKSKVSIEMTLTSPACPAGPQIVQNAKAVVGRLDGVADVEVKLVMEPAWTPDRMTDDARDQLGIF